MEPDSFARLKTSAEAVFCATESGGVLLHARDEVYFGLNGVGALIWEQLASGEAGDVEGVVRFLATRFGDVPEDVLRRDVGDLIADLLAAGLVLGPDA